jgi:catechol 2,3-dioxygenase-like lactoylglutathione lyase family enzyme
VITGVHTIIYSDDAPATRSFLRDVLELDSVDAGGGWLIFALPPAELAAHPGDGPARHELYLMCDDLDATIDELRAKGAEIGDEISEQRWGLTATLTVPGAGEMHLYEPRHPRPAVPDEHL